MKFFIFSFISSNIFDTSLIKANSSWLIFESNKALIKTSTLFNLDFANNSVLSHVHFNFLIIDLYFSIPAVTTQIYNAIAELVTPIGIPTKEAKAEIEMHPLTVEIKISQCSI